MTNSYIPRAITPPIESFFLFGPRGTGKSTWLAHAYPQSLRIDLLDRELERRLLAKPERLIPLVTALKQKRFASSMKFNGSPVLSL